MGLVDGVDAGLRSDPLMRGEIVVVLAALHLIYSPASSSSSSSFSLPWESVVTDEDGKLASW